MQTENMQTIDTSPQTHVKKNPICGSLIAYGTIGLVLDGFFLYVIFQIKDLLSDVGVSIETFNSAMFKVNSILAILVSIHVISLIYGLINLKKEPNLTKPSYFPIILLVLLILSLFYGSYIMFPLVMYPIYNIVNVI